MRPSVQLYVRLGMRLCVCGLRSAVVLYVHPVSPTYMRVEARRVAASRARGGAAAPAVQAACRPPPTEEGRAGRAGRHQRICRSRLSSALGTYAVPTDRDLTCSVETLGRPSPHLSLAAAMYLLLEPCN